MDTCAINLRTEWDSYFALRAATAWGHDLDETQNRMLCIKSYGSATRFQVQLFTTKSQPRMPNMATLQNRRGGGRAINEHDIENEKSAKNDYVRLLQTWSESGSTFGRLMNLMSIPSYIVSKR